ncbi:MAG: sugar phosphate isomerase/epimerase family protein [Planctomycetota bacterium]
MGFRLATATEDFGTDLRSAIRLAAEQPVQGLRLNARTEVRAADFSESALRQLRHQVEEHQLKVAGLYYPSRHSLADPASLEQRLDGIRAACSLVRKLGTSEVLIRVGRLPDPSQTAAEPAKDAPTNDNVDSLLFPFSFAPAATSAGRRRVSTPAEQFDTLCEILNDLAGSASRHGAVLQLIIAGGEPDHIRQLLARVQSGPVELVFDPGACVMSGVDPVVFFRSFWQQVGYIRLRDAQKDVDGGGIETAFGDGTVDWMELAAVLVDAAPAAWMCLERTGGDQRAADATDAVQRFRSLLPFA